MASYATSQLPVLMVLLSIIVAFRSPSGAEGFGGRKVGGRMEVEDVKTNTEIQELGRFSIEEYNRKQMEEKEISPSSSPSSSPLSDQLLEFTEVVGAERQVVSGIKYYLRIAAVKNGIANVFDAVVVVKPWVQSKQLVTFSPSTHSLKRSFNSSTKQY